MDLAVRTPETKTAPDLFSSGLTENTPIKFDHRTVTPNDFKQPQVAVDEQPSQDDSTIPKLSTRELKAQDNYPRLKDHIQDSIQQRQLDLTDEKSTLECMQSVRGFNAEVLKKSRWKNDAIIFKLSGSKDNSLYAVKIHPDVFPLCSHIYCDDTVKRINASGATTSIKDTFTIKLGEQNFRVVVYDFLEGTPLKKAMAKNKIEREAATCKLIEFERKLSVVNTYLVLRDQNDFLLLDDGNLVLTDWNAIVDVSNASKESLDGYADFKAGCIKDFMKSTEEYDKS